MKIWNYFVTMWGRHSFTSVSNTNQDEFKLKQNTTYRLSILAQESHLRLQREDQESEEELLEEESEEKFVEIPINDEGQKINFNQPLILYREPWKFTKYELAKFIFLALSGEIPLTNFTVQTAFNIYWRVVNEEQYMDVNLLNQFISMLGGTIGILSVPLLLKFTYDFFNNQPVIINNVNQTQLPQRIIVLNQQQSLSNLPLSFQRLFTDKNSINESEETNLELMNPQH